MGIEKQARPFSDDEVTAVRELLHQRRKDLTEIQARLPRARNAVELAALRRAKDDVQEEVDEAYRYLRAHGVEPYP